MKLILDLCSGTGGWSAPYRDNPSEYKVLSFDLPNDIRMVQYEDIMRHGLPVHGILAGPPCTVFANSGARWSRSPEDMIEGLSVMDACLRMVTIFKPKFWALENPIGKMKRFLGPAVMLFNPCDYGDPYTKKTLLWGDFKQPTKTPVLATEGSKMHLNYGGKSARTKRERSKTLAGFAKAFFEANR